MSGNPFLGPWANRLDQDAFFANGKKFLLNPELNNFRYDPHHHPIHRVALARVPGLREVDEERDGKRHRGEDHLAVPPEEWEHAFFRGDVGPSRGLEIPCILALLD